MISIPLIPLGYDLFEDRNLKIGGVIPFRVLSRTKRTRGIIRYKKTMVPDPNIYIIKGRAAIIGHPATLRELERLT